MNPNTQNPGATAALSGVRVVELSCYNAGALCAEALAFYGADVVRIESPAGESARTAASDEVGVDSFDFILLNANKRSVACDLATERGKEDLRTLIRNADVVVEHLEPGAIERLGFGYDAVRKLNPAIVYAHITGFASDGPHANYLSSDLVAQAVGGSMSGTGAVGGPPWKPGATVGDTGAALHCVMGILGALHQRRNTGRGQKVEVAMQDAVMNCHRTAYIITLMRGKAIERGGNGSKAGAIPSNLFPCKPGGPNDFVYIHIAKTAVKHWQSLLKVMGREDLANDPTLATPEGRIEHPDEVNGFVTAWCKAHTKMQAMQTLQGGGVPAAAVLDTRDLSEDVYLRRRGMFVTVEHPARGAVTMPGWPVRMSDSQVPVRSSPLLGAHTREVLSEWQARKEAPVRPGRPAPDSTTALSGVRVLDLTQFEAGTSCTEALAWMGADVVKVEEPGKGERGRSSNTDKRGVDSHYFLLLNANKRSLTCDLKSEQGKELLKKLIASADVMIENMAPGAIERLGFGYDVVQALNPRLIFAQIKGFGADGPYGSYLCFDTVAQTAGAGVFITGVPDEPPVRAGPNLGDTGSGLHCTTGILAALFQRQITGRGQHLQVAMQEAVINFSRAAFARHLASGAPPIRHTDRGIYRCRGSGANDYCAIDILEAGDQQWRRVLEAIGRDDLIDDERFASLEKRADHGEAVDSLLSAWCLQRTKTEAMDTLQKAGVPAGAVFDTQELISDPQLHQRGMTVTIQHPVRGPVTIPGSPVKMSDSHVAVTSAPLLGAHTEEVLAEWAGLDKDQIEDLLKPADVAN